jgi:lipopolysaccharide/colanic/teichoic acid biosynthesis glycosyltransferase
MKHSESVFIDTNGTKNHQAQGWAGISRPDVFQALLRHERSRSDRDGSEFSLAVFDVSSMPSSGRGIQQTASRIRDNMRSIDEAGWIDSKSIGVLLPVTGFEGGRKFAHRVGESVPCKVYTYPAHWLPAREDKGDGTIHKVFSHAVPAWKACLDVAGSLCLIVLSSPLFLLMALYIKVVSPGRVFFLQKRVGHRGRIFTFIKFRTMHEKSDPIAHRKYFKELIKNGKPMEKLDGARDTRIIPGGRIIRKLCLDELPQLFNVLRGDMSLVGPRPCIPYEVEEYLRWHAHRFDTLPGMTGLWQVSGKNKLSFEQMIRLDISYTNKMSFLLDLKILLLTGPAILEMVWEAGARKLRPEADGKASVSMLKSGEEGTLDDA